MKKFLTGLSLCLALTPTFLQESEATSLISASEWAKPYVYAGITSNIVPDSLQTGYNSPITRADFCALAVSTYETITGSEIRTRYSFSDTSDVNVEKMAGLGVVTGVTGTEFAPDSSITREQAAIILSNLSTQLGMELESATVDFGDNWDISSWAVDAVGKVNYAGIMGETGDNMFSPKSNYTKEQSILTLLKVFTMVSGVDMNALLEQASEEIAQMEPLKFYTPSLDGSGIPFEMFDLTPYYGEGIGNTISDLLEEINPLLYAMVRPFQGLDETNHLSEVVDFAIFYEENDSAVEIETRAELQKMAEESKLPGNLMYIHEIRDQDDQPIAILTYVKIPTNQFGYADLENLSLEYQISFFTGSFENYYAGTNEKLYKIVNNEIDAIYYDLEKQKFIDSSAPEDVNPPQQEGEPDNTPVVTKSNMTLYDRVLSPITDALYNNYHFGQLSSHNLSELYYYYNSTEVGYVFLDINNDGVDELLIGEVYGYTPNQLIAMYYLDGETPVLAFNAGERVHYYLCSDGLIASTGSSGFDSTESCTYELTSNGMVLVNDSRTKNPYNITDPWNPNYSSISTLPAG